MALVAASYATRAAASALPLWLIVAALAASRAAPSASARPSVTRPTEMMNEITSSSAGASTASSSENEPRSRRPPVAPSCRAMLSPPPSA